MYIREIRLENVRGFHDARNVTLDLTRPDGSLAGWTVLAGRNGSGKTSLLRAIALTIGGPLLARALVPDFANWVSMGKAEGKVSLGLVPDPDLDDSTLDGPFSVDATWRFTLKAAPGRDDREPALEISMRTFGTGSPGLWDEIGRASCRERGEAM